MRNLKIATIATYNGYLKEDLIVSILKKKYNIEFINTQTNEIIYTYDFVTIEKKENKKFVKYVNKSVYTRSRIYKQ